MKFLWKNSTFIQNVQIKLYNYTIYKNRKLSYNIKNMRDIVWKKIMNLLIR